MSIKNTDRVKRESLRNWISKIEVWKEELKREKLNSKLEEKLFSKGSQSSTTRYCEMLWRSEEEKFKIIARLRFKIRRLEVCCVWRCCFVPIFLSHSAPHFSSSLVWICWISSLQSLKSRIFISLVLLLFLIEWEDWSKRDQTRGKVLFCCIKFQILFFKFNKYQNYSCESF